MASYAFNSVVNVYSCRLNPNGLFTCDFGGSGATRDSSFSSICDYTNSYTGCTFIREEGVVVVKEDADTLKLNGVNYCRFQNPTFMGRWTYCFVDMIEYVAPKTAKLYIRTDAFMTWFDRIVKNDCFVEREHVASDNIFEHTLPEPTPNFESEAKYITGRNYWSQTPADKESNYWAAVYAVHDGDRTTWPVRPNTSGAIPYSGDVPSPGYLFGVDMGSVDELINELVHNTYDIVYAVCVPKVAVGTVGSTISGIYILTDKTSNDGYSEETMDIGSIGVDTISYSSGSYTFRNKKLCCYPYSYIEMNDLNDQSVIFKPEDMHSQLFYLHPEAGADPSFTLYYKDYEGETAFKNSISISNIPAIPYTIDFWTQYQALNKSALQFEKTQFGINLTKSIVTAGGSVVAGAYGGSIAGAAFGTQKAAPVVSALQAAQSGYSSTYQSAFNRAIDAVNASYVDKYSGLGAGYGALKAGIQSGGGIVDTVMNRMQQNAMYSDMKQRPPQMHNPTPGAVKFGMSAIGFNINRWVPKKEYIEVLDRFFDMYGYNVSMVKQPQWNSRSHYNYIKTAGANIAGQIPQEHKLEINNLLNNGLTVWHNASEYGTYTTNNGV